MGLKYKAQGLAQSYARVFPLSTDLLNGPDDFTVDKAQNFIHPESSSSLSRSDDIDNTHGLSSEECVGEPLSSDESVGEPLSPREPNVMRIEDRGSAGGLHHVICDMGRLGINGS